MAEVIVTRYGGGLVGQDIVEPLLGPDAAALVERGRVALDETAQRMQDNTLVTMFRTGVRAGQLVYSDDTIGKPAIGKIVGITHTFSEGVVSSNISLLCKAPDD